MEKVFRTITAVALVLILSSMVLAETLTIRPDGAGFRKGWGNVGCSSGSGEWQCVDEDNLDTSDYLQTSGTKKETFTFENTGLLSGSTIHSVIMHYVGMRHNNNKNRCFEAMTRSGGTDYLAGNQMCVGSSWEEVSHAYSTNPATSSAWTISEVDALEAGMKGLNPDGGGRVAQVWAVVNFTPFCGNNATEGSEVCDGTDLNGETCSSQGFDGGTLACNSGCDGFDTSSCWTSTCNETDSGSFPSELEEKGTVSGDANGEPFSFTDSCIDGDVLLEWACGGGINPAFNYTFDCSFNFTGCNDGACQ